VSLIRLLCRRHRLAIGLVLVLSLASAGLGVRVIAFVNDELIRAASPLPAALLRFAGLLAALFLVGAGAQLAMSTLGHRLVYDLRRTLVKRVLDTSIERLEQLGSARLLASLNSDTAQLTAAVVALPAVVYGLAINLGGLGYLAWLSPPLFLATAVWLAVAVVVAWALLRRTHREVGLARDAEDRLVADYQAVIEGRKELKLNRARARRVYEGDLEPDLRSNRDHEIRADLYNGTNDNWVNVMALGAIGLVFFVAKGLGRADTATAATYALGILYLRASLTNVVTAIPALIGGAVALGKVESLALAEYRADFDAPGDGLAGWRELRLEGLEYRYTAADGEAGFAVGPLDLTLTRGEVVFVAGGNGSGKSTLARLLTGLYQPQGGRIRVDGQVVEGAAVGPYRRLFASVFSDFHLFCQLLGGGEQPASEAEVDHWLGRLGMTGKAPVGGGRLLDTRLSHGQRKRLALLLAILEGRSILVLDEWAADQDPVFRRVFYDDVLPALRAAGRTVVAITHDDRYFDRADRLLQMDSGCLVPWRSGLAPAAESPRQLVPGGAGPP
jgi:multidrug/microcin transport system ATP-binding/permease protein